jgi:hypothetical protein
LISPIREDFAAKSRLERFQLIMNAISELFRQPEKPECPIQEKGITVSPKRIGKKE